MSVLTDLIFAGSNAVAGLTENAVNEAIARHGADAKIAFPDTAYFFPTIYAATGVKVTKLGDLPACVGVLKSLISNKPELGDALNAGLATAVGAEIIEGLKYAESENPYAEDSGITSAGVFIRFSIAGIIKMPAAVNTMPSTSVMTMAVCTASCTFSGRFAP